MGEELDNFKQAKTVLENLFVFLETICSALHGDYGVSALMNHYYEILKLFEETLETFSGFIESEMERTTWDEKANNLMKEKADYQDLLDLYCDALQERYENTRERLILTSELISKLQIAVKEEVSKYESLNKQLDFDSIIENARNLEDSCMKIYKEIS